MNNFQKHALKVAVKSSKAQKIPLDQPRWTIELMKN